MLTLQEAKDKFSELFHMYSNDAFILATALRVMEEWYTIQGKEVRRFHKYSGKLAGDWPIYLMCDRWAYNLREEMSNALQNGETEIAMERYMKLNVFVPNADYEPGYVAIASLKNRLSPETYSLLREDKVWVPYGLLTMSTRPFINLVRYPFETRYYVDSKNMRGLLCYTSSEVVAHGDEIPVLRYISIRSGDIKLQKIEGKTFYRGYKLKDEEYANPIHEFVKPTNDELVKIVLEETYGCPEKGL